MKKSYVHLFLVASLALPVGLSTATAQQVDQVEALPEVDQVAEVEADPAHVPFYTAHKAKGVAAVAVIALGGAVWKGIAWQGIAWKRGWSMQKRFEQLAVGGLVKADLEGWTPDQTEAFAGYYLTKHQMALGNIAGLELDVWIRHHSNVTLILDGLVAHHRSYRDMYWRVEAPWKDLVRVLQSVHPANKGKLRERECKAAPFAVAQVKALAEVEAGPEEFRSPLQKALSNPMYKQLYGVQGTQTPRNFDKLLLPEPHILTGNDVREWTAESMTIFAYRYVHVHQHRLDRSQLRLR